MGKPIVWDGWVVSRGNRVDLNLQIPFWIVKCVHIGFKLLRSKQFPRCCNSCCFGIRGFTRDRCKYFFEGIPDPKIRNNRYTCFSRWLMPKNN